MGMLKGCAIGGKGWTDLPYVVGGGVELVAERAGLKHPKLASETVLAVSEGSSNRNRDD